MRIKDKIKKVIVSGTSAAALMLAAHAEYYPSLDTTLNDFDPEVAVGEYIQSIASNTVSETVVLSNGVLSVNGETINVAEPTHTVITTNGSETVTNVYNAVYEDGLANTLTNYATIVKTTVTTNGTEITTNTTTVAYLDDIPPDSQKADKVMRLWDYQSSDGTTLLTRRLNRDAPFAFWEGTNTVDEVVSLFYTNGIWTVESGSTRDEVYGTEDAALIQFPNYSNTFSMVNDTRYAFVVYTDMMEEEFRNRLGEYVTKSNLYGVAKRIEEGKLHTMGGIQEILRGIRNEINSMAEGSGIHLSFNNVGGSTLVLGTADMRIPGDSVLIDWGDGSSSVTNLPARHTYAAGVGSVEVIITGFIREISGTMTRAEEGIFPFASFTDNTNRLVRVKIDPIVGLESLGYAAFYDCSRLAANLEFVPSTVTNIGTYCFAKSGITSLVGFPASVRTIPKGCFMDCDGLSNLSGLPSPGIIEIGDDAFRDCSGLTSLSGIPQGIVALGSSSFEGCALESISELASLNLTTIPERCFRGTSISAIDGIPGTVTAIGNAAFENCGNLLSVEINTALTSIGSNGFARCTNLVSADLSLSSLTWTGEFIFGGCSKLESATFPSSITNMAANSFQSAGAELEADSLTVTFDKRLDDGPDAIDKITTSEGLQAIYFGIEVNGSEIKGRDGYYKLEEEGWKKYSTVTEFALTSIPGTSTVTLGEIVTPLQERQTKRAAMQRSSENPGIIVDWGDGITNSATSHAYSLPSATNLTIKVIGRVYAFGGGTTTPFVTIGNGSTNAFLTGVNVGNAVGLTKLGQGAFRNCTELSVNEIVGLGAGISEIGEECFMGCSSIGSCAFLSNTTITAYSDGCFKDSGVLQFGEGSPAVKNIGTECFANTPMSDGIGFPASLETMGAGAFENTSVGNGFIACLSATSVTNIPSSCFKGCINLTRIEEGLENVVSVGTDAFAMCRKVEEISLPKVMSIGSRAFEEVGASAPRKTTEDNLPYTVVVNMTGQNFKDAADILGLSDGEGSTSESGLGSLTIVNCSDNAVLAYNNNDNKKRWEVVTEALEVSLANVPDRTEFKVHTDGATAFTGASLIWNWGDGSTSGWVDGAPTTNHIYSTGGTSNYIVKVKGLLKSVSSAPNVGAFIRPEGESDNQYLTGFRIPDGSSIQTIGEYSFSRCPNLRAVNRIDSARGVDVDKKKRTALTRDGGRSLASLYEALLSQNETIEFGNYCFSRSGVSDLSSFPSEVTKLSEGLFEYCPNITTLYGLNDDIVDMGGGCFANDMSLSTLEGFPNSLTYIASNGFQNCSSLGSLSALSGSSVGYIGDYAFAGCRSLLSLYGLPERLQLLGEGVFAGSSLSSLNGLPSSITNIPPYAFGFNRNLQNLTIASTNIATVGTGAFIGCENLTSFSLASNQITAIDQWGFANCYKISEGSLPSGLKSIGKDAFIGVGSDIEPSMNVAGIVATAQIKALAYSTAQLQALLEENGNSNGVENVVFECEDGFLACQDSTWITYYKDVYIEMADVRPLTKFYIGYLEPVEGTEISIDWGDGTIEPYQYNMGHTYAVSGDYVVRFRGYIRKMYCSELAYPIVRSRANGNDNIVGIRIGSASRCDEVGDYCFKGCGNLEDVLYLSSSRLTKLGKDAFARCRHLQTLIGLPSTLQSIDEGCFRDCEALVSIIGYPDSMTYMPSNCFENCTGIVSISNLSQQITALGYRCFAGCTNLSNLVGLTNCTDLVIGDYCFAECTGLQNLIGLETNRMDLARGMFAGCSGITSFVGLPTTVYSIPERCFENCTGIDSLATLLPTVQILGDYSFNGCSGMTELSANLTNIVSIGKGAFANCGLRSLDGLSGQLLSIQAEAFSYNTNLTSISALANCTNIFYVAERCFYGCTSLGNGGADIVLPSFITKIGDYAFYGCSLATLHEIPDICKYIGTNAFAQTAIEDISIITTNVYVLIASNAFDAMRNEVDRSIYGLGYRRRIAFPGLTCEEIKNYYGFPFGSPYNLIFEGSDGWMVYHDGEWVSVPLSATIDLYLKPNYVSSTSIGIWGIVPSDRHGYCIEWGDGTYSNWCQGITNYVHTYPMTVAGTNYVIKLRRHIQSYGIPNAMDIEQFDRKSSVVHYVLGNYEVRGIKFEEDCGITELGQYALSGAAIKSVPELPSTVTNIGSYCFSGSAITNLVNLGEVAPSVYGIAPYAFSSCGNLATNTTIAHPDIKTLREGTFANCPTLKHLTAVCPNMETFEPYVFRDTLVTNVDFRETRLYKIPNDGLRDCRVLYNFTMPTCEYVGTNALLGVATSGARKYNAELGVLYRTIFNIPSGSIYNLLENLERLTKDAIYYCADGTLAFYDLEPMKTSWIIKYKKFAIHMENIPPGTRFNVGNIEVRPWHQPLDGIPYAPQNIDSFSWSWGDGITYTNCHSSADVPPVTLALGGAVTITIDGPLKSISGLSSSQPFIYADGMAGNPYITQLGLYAITNFVIGDFAFSKCPNIRTYNLSNSLYSGIGERAFAENEGLKSIDIPNSCLRIGDEAFAGCTQLTNVVMQLSPHSYGKPLELGNDIFTNCQNLVDVEIVPGGPKKWPQCSENTWRTGGGITIHSELSPYASLTNQISFPFGLHDSSTVDVFEGFLKKNDGEWELESQLIVLGTTTPPARKDNLKNPAVQIGPLWLYEDKPYVIVDWGDGNIERVNTYTGPELEPVYYIGRLKHNYSDEDSEKYLFIRVRGHISKIAGTQARISHDGDGKRCCDYRAFVYKGKTWTYGVWEIFDLINSDPNLNYVDIGERVGLRTIGEGCFAWNWNLNNIHLPSTVTNFERSAFAFSGIDNLHFLEDTRPNKIAPYCFAGCRNLTSLAGLPAGVVTIDDWAFTQNIDPTDNTYGYMRLPQTRISSLRHMPQSVRTIGMGAFAWNNISSLEYISTNLTSLGSEAFANNRITNLEHLPKSVSSIPARCFQNNSLNTLVGMPDSITYIGEDALSPFYGSNLVGLSTNCVAMSNALSYTPNLRTLDGFPPLVRTIAGRDFSGCPATTFKVPSWVETIGYAAFSKNVMLLLDGKTPADIDDVGGNSGIHWGPVLRRPFIMGSGASTDPAGDLSKDKVVCVNGCFFRYVEGKYIAGYVDGEGVRHENDLPVNKRVDANIRAVFDITSPNVEIQLGELELRSADTPLVCDWGDGTVEYMIGTVPTGHIYLAEGTYTNTITTFATAMNGKDGKPFYTTDEGDNPYLTEFYATDFTGIEQIGESCFFGCVNLPKISFISTTGINEEGLRILPAASVKDVRNGGFIPYKPLWSSDLQAMPGYPFGFARDLRNIIGVEGRPFSYIDFTMENVEPNTYIIVDMQDSASSIVSIDWGDDTRSLNIENKETRHRYTTNSTYVIRAYGGYKSRIAGKRKGVILFEEAYFDHAINRADIYAKWGNRDLSLLHIVSVRGDQPDAFNPDGIYWRRNYYYDNRYLTSVSFGRDVNITTIGTNAFASCSVLKKIEWPPSAEVLEGHAFRNSNIRDFGQLPFKKLEPFALDPYESEFLRGWVPHRISAELRVPFSEMDIAEGAFGSLSSVLSPPPMISFNGTTNEVMNAINFPFCYIDHRYIGYVPRELYGYVVESIIYECTDGRIQYNGSEWKAVEK